MEALKLAQTRPWAGEGPHKQAHRTCFGRLVRHPLSVRREPAVPFVERRRRNLDWALRIAERNRQHVRLSIRALAAIKDKSTVRGPVIDIVVQPPTENGQRRTLPRTVGAQFVDSVGHICGAVRRVRDT